ncbi:MAG: protease inhibitor I42 family protein [Candidatus Omnitrophica bacterium]|nr:protease inhibitor I42 family protein [Candidatus Omnitrophota bacterium]
MGKRNLFVVLLTCAVFLLTVTSFAQSVKDQVVSESVINVTVGENIVIILESNRTTGYLWRLGSDLNDDKIEFVKSNYFASKTKLLGAPGKETWIFKALKPGRLTLVFEYRRPWEKKLKPIKIENFTIIIKEK